MATRRVKKSKRKFTRRRHRGAGWIPRFQPGSWIPTFKDPETPLAIAAKEQGLVAETPQVVGGRHRRTWRKGRKQSHRRR